MNNIRTVNNSNLPISIKKAAHNFPAVGISVKLLEGPNSPKAGPTLPKLEAATPIEDSKSNPNKAKPKDPTIKDNIYRIKNPRTLKTISPDTYLLL